jgi:hypothetical protein
MAAIASGYKRSFPLAAAAIGTFIWGRAILWFFYLNKLSLSFREHRILVCWYVLPACLFLVSSMAGEGGWWLLAALLSLNAALVHFLLARREAS